MEEWVNRYHLTKQSDSTWYKNTALVVIGKEEDHKALLEAYHNTITAKHPEMAKTL